MPSELPVPIEFQLPEQWRPASPEEVGAPTAAYVALRPEPAGDFVANITISGELHDDGKPLAAIADESLNRLRETAPDARVTRRADVGSERAPGLTQVAMLSTQVGGTSRELVQIHVFLDLAGERRAIVELVLTAGREEFDEVVTDFRQFITTVGPHEQ